MIDTVKFYVKCTPEIYKAILQNSIEVVKYSHKNKQIMYQFINSSQEIGSYSSSINICLLSESAITIELSLPKYLFGHNVFLLYPTQFVEVMNSLHSDLCTDFSTEFPDWHEWIIYRLDICYAWKYKTQENAQSVMRILQRLDYPRKTKYLYSTESVMYKGDYFSPKFYLKYDEFYVHDFKKLKNSDNMKAFHLSYQMLEIAKGVLRYEVTMRKKYLDNIFKKELYLQDITQEWIEEKLREFLIRLMSNMGDEAVTQQEAYNRLVKAYGQTSGFRLWLLYMYLKENGKEALKTKYNSNQAYKNIAKMSAVGLSVFDDSTINIDFDLLIPSEYCINMHSIVVGDSQPQVPIKSLPPSNTGGEC